MCIGELREDFFRLDQAIMTLMSRCPAYFSPLNVFFLQEGPWLTTYRSAVTRCWTRTPSFTSLSRSYLHSTTSTTSSFSTETWRRRTFSWTSTKWSSKLEISASPKSLSAKAKLTRWAGGRSKTLSLLSLKCLILKWNFCHPAGGWDPVLHLPRAVWRKAI